MFLPPEEQSNNSSQVQNRIFAMIESAMVMDIVCKSIKGEKRPRFEGQKKHLHMKTSTKSCDLDLTTFHTGLSNQKGTDQLTILKLIFSVLGYQVKQVCTMDSYFTSKSRSAIFSMSKVIGTISATHADVSYTRIEKSTADRYVESQKENQIG